MYLIDYSLQWFLLVALFTFLACAFPVRRVVGSLAASTILYFFLTAENVWLNPLSSYSNITPYDLLGLRQFATDSIMKFVVVVSPMLYLASQNRRALAAYGTIAAAVFCLLDPLFSVAQLVLSPDRCRGENTCGGIIGNPSMNACFLVVLLPIALKALDVWAKVAAAVLVVFVVLISKASIPIGLLVALVALMALGLTNRRTAAIAIICSPLLLLLGRWLLGSELLNSGDRLLMWKFFLSKWNVVSNWIFGTGYGTFGVFSINVQKHFHMRDNGWWIWIHNDWLQELFEVGLVGLLLMAATYLRALLLLVKERLLHEAVSLILYGLMMLMNYPAHLAPTAAFGAWLAVVALSSKQRIFPLLEPRPASN